MSSDPNRIYVSGFSIVSSTSYVGSIARSSDRGATWTVVPIPGSDNAAGPYIGAIDPSDPQTLYVRLEGDSGKLLVSHDGGDGFQTIYTAKGKLLGFALAPDGKTSSRNRHDRSQKRHPEAVLTRKKWAASPKLKKPSSSGSLVRDDCGPLLEILCATPSREFSTDRRGERKGEGLSVPDLSVGAPSSSRRR